MAVEILVCSTSTRIKIYYNHFATASILKQVKITLYTYCLLSYTHGATHCEKITCDCKPQILNFTIRQHLELPHYRSCGWGVLQKL